MKIAIALLVLLSAIFLFYGRNLLKFPSSPSSYDVIVVGSGLAGLSAALECYNQNASVLLIEKESYMGGNSMKATSGINLLFTMAQYENNVHDSKESFISDTMISSKNLSIPKLVDLLAQGAIESIEFLEKYGLELNSLSILGGHSFARTHRPKDKPVGATMTSILSKYILQSTKIEVRLNTTAVELIKDEDEIIRGIKIMKDKDPNTLTEIKAKAIILATGGFGHDFSENSLIKEFNPELLDFPTTNGPQAEGLGLKMARKIGAGLLHMEHIQLHPTGFVDPNDRFSKKKFLAPELMRGIGGILLNDKGERFCNELGTRDYVTEKILEKGDKTENQTEVFLVIPEEGRVEYGKNFDFYVYKGFLSLYKNWEDLGNSLLINIDGIKNTLEKYEMAQKNGKDEFGKTIFSKGFHFEKGVYVGKVTPSIHYTMGGLKMNERGSITKENGEIIPRLYGAGEVTGGVHGGNRLGGNSLLECVVFGRIAAKSAINDIKSP